VRIRQELAFNAMPDLLQILRTARNATLYRNLLRQVNNVPMEVSVTVTLVQLALVIVGPVRVPRRMIVSLVHLENSSSMGLALE
jgi:hypothetical protein